MLLLLLLVVVLLLLLLPLLLLLLVVLLLPLLLLLLMVVVVLPPLLLPLLPLLLVVVVLLLLLLLLLFRWCVKHLCDNIKKQLRAAWNCLEDDKLVYCAARAKDEEHFVQAIAELRQREPRKLPIARLLQYLA